MTQEFSGYKHFYRPPKGESKTIFVTLHGTGGSEQDLIPMIDEIDPDAGVLSPLGNVEDHGMARYFKRPRQGVFDEEDIELHAKELVHFVNKASEAYKFDRKELVWLGYSNGANMISAIMLLHPTVITRAALLRPMVTLIPEQLPVFSDVNVLLAAASQDKMVPMESTEKLIRMFQHAGAIVELFLQHATHALEDSDIRAVNDWYSKLSGRKITRRQAPEQAETPQEDDIMTQRHTGSTEETSDDTE